MGSRCRPCSVSGVPSEDPVNSSLITPKNWDDRLIFLFQIGPPASNHGECAESSINLLTKRDHVIPPNSGLQCS